jgi:hypothetical protein
MCGSPGGVQLTSVARNRGHELHPDAAIVAKEAGIKEHSLLLN